MQFCTTNICRTYGKRLADMRPPEALFSPETKRQALERANYQCESCGKRGRLEIHHILPIYIATQVYQDLPHVALSVLENALCLCIDCHNKEHGKDWFLRDYSMQAQLLFALAQLPVQETTTRVQNPDQMSFTDRQRSQEQRRKPSRNFRA